MKVKAKWMGLLFFLMLLIVPAQASAAGWTMQGKACEEQGAYVLTKSGSSGAVGVVSRDIPVDTRNGFTLTFDYYVGDVLLRAREGFQVVFNSNPLEYDSLSYWNMGYWEYVASPEISFHAVKFDSDDKNIVVAKNNGKKLTYITDKYTTTISDGVWHSVRIEYAGGMLKVYRDSEAIFTNVSCALPNVVFVGFTAGTSYYGSETHMVKNMNLQAVDGAVVYLDANGGSCSLSGITAVNNYKVKLPKPTHKTHTFMGWYTAKKGGKKVNAKNYKVTGAKTLYAHWKDMRRKVTFKAGKGRTSEKTRMVNKGKKIDKLPSAYRSGYTFLGWYTKKSGGKKITKKYKVKKKMVLYAHWKKKKTSSSSSSSGSGSTSSSSSSKYSQNCVSCHGSGRCSTCGGDGYRYSYAMDNERLNCYKCNASGRCSTCHGTGKR